MTSFYVLLYDFIKIFINNNLLCNNLKINASANLRVQLY